METSFVAVRLMEEENDLLDWLVAVGGFDSRSHALREALLILARQYGGGVQVEQIAKWSNNARKAKRSTRVMERDRREGVISAADVDELPQPDIILEPAAPARAKRRRTV